MRTEKFLGLELANNSWLPLTTTECLHPRQRSRWSTLQRSPPIPGLPSVSQLTALLLVGLFWAVGWMTVQTHACQWEDTLATNHTSASISINYVNWHTNHCPLWHWHWRLHVTTYENDMKCGLVCLKVLHRWRGTYKTVIATSETQAQPPLKCSL